MTEKSFPAALEALDQQMGAAGGYQSPFWCRCGNYSHMAPVDGCPGTFCEGPIALALAESVREGISRSWEPVLREWSTQPPPRWSIQVGAYAFPSYFDHNPAPYTVVPLPDRSKRDWRVLPPVPVPSHTPPPWAQDPARTRRTGNRSTDARTPRV